MVLSNNISIMVFKIRIIENKKILNFFQNIKGFPKHVVVFGSQISENFDLRHC